MRCPKVRNAKLAAILTLSLLVLLLPTSTAQAQTAPAIDPAKASEAFTEARLLSEKDAGHLWGKPLYGPMIFVSPATREVVANQPDGEGLLRPQGTVYIGSLPREVMMANTAVGWAGKRWTMVMWPLPQHSQPRSRLLAHELFHRIQAELHIPAANPENPQLDTLEGRLWLQLEWRALAAALIESGAAQTQALRDALAFRAHRRQLFPGSAESERALELNEGLAEYTGVRLSAPDDQSAGWHVVARLTGPQSETFVRSFAYASGPAYGLLLDQRLPGWRSKIGAQSDLGTLLASAIQGAPSSSAEQAARRYGAAALRTTETERAALADAAKARYRKLLVDGPTLTLSNEGKFSFGFDPNGLVPLPPMGTVYPAMQASDAWGTLDVKEGALLASDFKSVRVAAPSDTSGTHIAGPGWTLELAPGWHIVPSEKAGGYVVQKQ